ncbi:MAG: hypothetical protein A2X13_09210 [Bacteroidetes bacterium GWC2_33_15]|nr:MAG: hypothetical protein A2X10_01840 [Bacteroidetes bacterium GWA2_33_15]OFX49125.1 MAG: hypothetical protein A2X13_09210 [Bacteroidetes bacterium GWC2_33_15]OFX64893.1 MAG: hypothetical protein A2X15_06085 [Bacteroidetes bacterium GWB2_32_14]OFX68601.1 MAG: hypothetical protein A2X14_14650 [Bacteroidetes bacterium GWD2_33_33]HAN17451.1 hypothetical protein [Bacteroidales bacterium]
MKNQSSPNLLFIAGITLIVVLSLFLQRAPKPLSLETGQTEFSAERAFEHTRQIAQKPHMIGTEEHSRVKQYIVNELQKLGLETEIQQTTAIHEFRGVVRAGFVQNIIGTIKGDESNKSVLIVGHYDSQPNAPGAADDGSAVAAMLEAARALKQHAKLKNDILFLFSDAEEVGLLGAKAFVDEHRLTGKIGIVFNIEARGTKGPSITFEVSPENGWIMREFIKAVPYPIAHSIAYEVYKILPNDTDFTIFKKIGISGFNAALTDGYVNYHSPTDKPENLSLSSLQHQGSYIMGIAKHFGNTDLTQTKSEDVVYFNLLGYLMILYPVSLNMVLIIIVSLLFAFYIFIGIRKKRITPLKLIIGMVVFIITLAIIIGFAWLMQKGIIKKYPHYTLHYYWNFYNIRHYFVAFTALSAAIFSFIYTLLNKKPGIENLFAGSLFVSFIAMFALQKYFPTGSYLFIIPLLFILIATIICYLFNFDAKHSKKMFFGIYFILLIPVIFLFTPLIKLFYIVFGLKLIFAGVVLTVFLSAYLLMVLKAFIDYKKWLFTAGAFLTGMVFLITGHLNSNYSKEQPLQSNVMYCLNTDTNKAFWVSENLRTDEWNQQFFTNADTAALTEIYPFSNQIRLINTAPILDFPKPDLKIISDSIISNSRIVEIEIKSNRNAGYSEIYIHKDANLANLKINGHAITNTGFYEPVGTGYYTIYYFGLYENGCRIKLECNTSKHIEIFIAEKKMGLPLPGNYKQMPDYIIPGKDYNSNLSLVKCSWEI